MPHLKPWMPWAGTEPESIETKVERIRGHRWAQREGRALQVGMFPIEGRPLLGIASLERRSGEAEREIGYWVHTAHTRRGVATEASAALTRVGFEVERAASIEIQCDPLNVASAGVPRKLGYAHRGTLPHHKRNPAGQMRATQIWWLDAASYARAAVRVAPVVAWDAGGRRLL